jgi:putative peptidoglycan lipid II flippase
LTVRRLAVAATIVAFFTVASRALGFVRDIVLSGTYGASGEADAFVSSLLIVNSAAAVLLYALVTVVIPQFQAERSNYGEASAWRLAWTLAAWVATLLVIFSGFLAVFPQAAASLYRVNPELAAESAPLIRIMAPAVLLQGLSALSTALLQIHGRFAGPAAVGVAFNAGIIGGVLIWSDAIGIEAAAWGVTVGAVLQLALQMPQFVRVMRGVDVTVALTHPRLRMTALLAAPVFAASLLQQVNNFSDKIFAATLEEGRVAALTWANTVGQAPRALLLLPVLTPLFPVIARLVAEGRRPEVVGAYRRAAGLLGVLGIPVGAFLIVYAQEISSLLFERGKCDAGCVDEIASPLTFYGLAVWAGFMGFLNNRVLSAVGRTREVMIATIIVVAVTIALDFVLIGPLEQSGLALASAIALFVNVVVTFTFLRREFPALEPAPLARQQLRLVVAALVAVGAVLVADLLLPSDTAIGLELAGGLIAKSAVGAVVYAAAVRVIAPNDFEHARALLASVLRRRSAPA